MEVLEIVDQGLDFKGYIAIDSLVEGMSFGGFRFHPSVSRQQVVYLARCMTWKLAGHGLPVGGAKGGICVDPQNPNILKILETFAEQASSVLKSKTILGKDVGATDAFIDHMYKHISIPQMHIVKAKYGNAVPNRLREMRGYQKHMTGLGVSWAANSILHGNMNGRTFVIQGSGAVGIGTAYRVIQMGAKVIGISDVNKSISNREGIPFDQLVNAAQGGNLVTQKLKCSYKEASPSELFSVEADVVVLAATSHSVTVEMADSIESPVVIEGANFGLAPEARSKLRQRGVVVVPDIIASSSSAAMVAHQMALGNALSEEELWKKIQQSIQRSVQGSAEISKVENIDLREAYIRMYTPQYLEAVGPVTLSF